MYVYVIPKGNVIVTAAKSNETKRTVRTKYNRKKIEQYKS